jgi:DnaJ-class molecular chaperone
METDYPSFMKFTEYYFEASYLFFRMFLTPPTFPGEQERKMTIQPRIPNHLQAEYTLLHLPAHTSLTEARRQYRQLAKRSHPDAGGQHADFLLLKQAYERVVEYLRKRQD